MIEPIYYAISWIMLRWHALWALVVPAKAVLATNWQWILAIIFLVLTVRGLLFPVFVKQIKSQRAMQALAPQMKELQEKHKGDRETLQREMMELYKREKANPLMGCLPLVVQIPIFFGLFHVLRHLKPTMPARLQTIYGWTATQFDSASHAKLFGAPISASFRSPAKDLVALDANGTTVKIVAAVLVAIMIVTTFMTSRQMILKTGWSEEPQQRMVQRLMLYGVPVSLLVSGFAFPIGVVIYWVTTNLFSLGQQFWVLRKFPPPPMAKTKTSGGRTAPGARTAATPTAGRSAAGRNTERTGPPAKNRPRKAPAGTRANLSASTNGHNGVQDADGVDARSLAPRPGAKPVNPKKRGSTTRRTG